jgi:hypothetical protein
MITKCEHTTMKVFASNPNPNPNPNPNSDNISRISSKYGNTSSTIVSNNVRQLHSFQDRKADNYKE